MIPFLELLVPFVLLLSWCLSLMLYNLLMVFSCFVFAIVSLDGDVLLVRICSMDSAPFDFVVLLYLYWFCLRSVLSSLNSWWLY